MSCTNGLETVKAGDNTAAPKADEVHLWIIDCDRPHEIECARKLLDEQERGKADRFINERDSWRYIAAHAALRSILAGYIGTKAETIRFRYGPHGKPELDAEYPDYISFNMSHSERLVLVAIAAGRPVGVDVERVSFDFPCIEIARSHFSREESSELESLSQDRQALAFYRAWTHKEAFLKALGAGLSISPKDVALPFVETPGQANIVAMNGTLWSFVDVVPARGYIGAIAVKGEIQRIIKLEYQLL